MFTYDNLRLMPYVPHSMNIKKHATAEIAPDKERLKPNSYSHISWLGVFNKSVKVIYHNVIKSLNPTQCHSELLDMILDRFNYEGFNHPNGELYPDNNYDNMNNNSGTVEEFLKNYDILHLF